MNSSIVNLLIVLLTILLFIFIYYLIVHKNRNNAQQYESNMKSTIQIKNNTGTIVSNNFNGQFYGNNISGTNMIVGSGIPKTIDVEPQSFKKILITGSIEVDFSIDSTSYIQVTADDNLIELIELSYFNDTLDIGFKNNSSFQTKSPIKVKIHHPILRSVQLTGSGDLNVFNLNQDQIEVAINGSSDVSLTGTVAEASFIVNGSGNIDAEDLKAENINAEVSGSGDIVATAKKSAFARIAGSGDIKIYGNPTIQKSKVSGSGKIKFK